MGQPPRDRFHKIFCEGPTASPAREQRRGRRRRSRFLRGARIAPSSAPSIEHGGSARHAACSCGPVTELAEPSSAPGPPQQASRRAPTPKPPLAVSRRLQCSASGRSRFLQGKNRARPDAPRKRRATARSPLSQRQMEPEKSPRMTPRTRSAKGSFHPLRASAISRTAPDDVARSEDGRDVRPQRHSLRKIEAHSPSSSARAIGRGPISRARSSGGSGRKLSVRA